MQLRPYQSRDLDTIKRKMRSEKNGICVMGTGGGKSIMIARLAEYITSFAGHRVLVLAHRKELLEQNALKFSDPISLYSAGLDEKCTKENIIIAGIQSCYDKPEFEGFSAIIVDECHLISQSEDSMYQQLLSRNEGTRLIGFTATPYRTGEGKLTWGSIWTNTGYCELLSGGYVAPLVYKATEPPEKLKNVSIVAGNYVVSQLEDVYTEKELLEESVKKILQYGHDRKKWLIFCNSVRHVELLGVMLIEAGIICDGITGKTRDRDLILEGFRKGAYRAILNCCILTTGSDFPDLDFLVILNPTMSAGLHEQILGRGVRQHHSKKDCLVLDMAGNTAEHGFLGKIEWGEPQKKRKQNKGKICPSCESIQRPNAKSCLDCGFVFPEPEPSRLISHEPDQVVTETWYDVSDMSLSVKESKATGIPMLVATYITRDYNQFNRYVCIEHNGYAKDKAIKWIQENIIEDVAEYPQFAVDAAQYTYKIPSRILVRKAGKFPEIIQEEYEYIEKTIDIEDEIPF